jgi:lipopolysaccharide heptosyltransferase I
MNVSVPQRILLVRLSAIGDCVHGLPVLCALRARFPSAHIGWVVEGRTAELLQGHPALNQVFQVPRGWLKSPAAVYQLWRQLRAERFDVAIDLQGLSKSAVAARLSGARRRIGFTGCDGREISTWLNNEFVEPTATHVIDRTLELLKPLGIEQPKVTFGLARSAADKDRINQLLSDLALTRFAVINTGAGWPSKLWPTDRFASAAQYLLSEHGLPVLVTWGSDDERIRANAIVQASEGAARLAPRVTLSQLAELFRRAALFLGSDTGPLHLAVAVGTPSVGLFGPASSERNGPYGHPHLGLQRMQLTGSTHVRRQENGSSMAAISIADACAACATVLARSQQQYAA